MSNQQSTITTELPIQLQTLTGSALFVIVKRITLQYDGESSSCEMQLEISGETCQCILEDEWFHLFRSTRVNLATFEPDQPVQLLVALRPSITRQLAAQGLDAEDIFNELLPNTHSAARLTVQLNHTECWIALELKQTVMLPNELEEGTLNIKLRTSWSNELSVTPTSEGLDQQHHDQQAIIPLREQITRYLEGLSLKVEQIDSELLRLPFHTDTTNWISLFRIDEASRLCVIYSIFPTMIPAYLREETALAFMAENYGSIMSSYEMDNEDGELRYRTTLTVGKELDISLLAAALAEHLQVMEHFIPIIQDVLNQGS